MISHGPKPSHLPISFSHHRGFAPPNLTRHLFPFLSFFAVFVEPGILLYFNYKMASKDSGQPFAPVLAAVATMQGNVSKSEKTQAHEFLEKFQKSVCYEISNKALINKLLTISTLDRGMDNNTHFTTVTRCTN